MTIKETIKKDINHILEIYDKGLYGVEPKNITQTAEAYCKLNDITYSDSWRRSLSNIISSFEGNSSEEKVEQNGEKREFTEDLKGGTAELVTYVHKPVKTLDELI